MKTKSIAFLELAIVLCSLFLVAIPAIAAAQNAQKVSACTVTTANEDDFVLGIYGNANEDDTIDMRDLTYVKLIFFGERPETELADAKYDDEINPLDFVQIKLIIVGKEKELTLLQYLGMPSDIIEEPVTVPMPIERIVAIGGTFGPETLCALAAQDIIVGVSEGSKKREELKTFLVDKPSVGSNKGFDLEKIIELKPDIVLAYAYGPYGSFPDDEEKLNAAGISLVQMDFFQSDKYSKEIRNLGWLLAKNERAEKLINFEQQHINHIKERVTDLNLEEKIRVYYCGSPGYYGVPTHTTGEGTPTHAEIELCGGINIFADLEGWMTADPEEVIVRNPQVIYANTWSGAKTAALGYGITDTSSVEEVRTEAIMNYPGFDHIDAVKSGHVYFISTDAKSTHSSVFYSYLAKYFYPELFEDIDPVAIHRDWLNEFLGIPYKGVYTYPTPWEQGADSSFKGVNCAEY